MPPEGRSAVMVERQQGWRQLFEAADQAVRLELWDEAEQLLQETLALDPTHAAAEHLLGKVLAERNALSEALAAQQRSCQLDPALGWNWFASGELLLELQRFSDAAAAFEQALAALPAEGWIAEQCTEARLQVALQGERLDRTLGPLTYGYWIAHHEPRLVSAALPLQQPYWLLTNNAAGELSWMALHSQAPLQPPAAPLGHSPWPVEGWLVLLGPGSLLRAGALQAIEQWLQDESTLPLPDLLYGDEDRLDAAGVRHDPWFKPGWVEESFWASPWLGSLSLWRLSWLRERELPLPPGDASGRLAWMLQALETEPTTAHVPLVLSHNRQPPAPLEPAALQALQTHLERRGEPGVTARAHPQLPGCAALQWPLPKTISCTVVIPTRDRAELLSTCLSSLWHSTTAERAQGLELEIMVVDNGSVQARTQALLAQWQQRLGAQFVVVADDGPFNWSRLNNRAAALARGELLLLLNNDIEAHRPGWLGAMAAQALRPAVGCVGAVLLYPDGGIQHGGVVIGMHSAADHAYRNLPLDHGMHSGRSRLLSGWGAVTGACLLVRRALLWRAGGFDEGLPVEFNDVDFCLRLGQLGYRHVIPPEAVLLHHESQSRDAHSSSTALQALRRVQRRWPGRFASAAPWWPDQSERNCADGRPVGLEGLPI